MTKFFSPRAKRESIRTTITSEQCASNNPFVADKSLWHGYDAEQLASRYSWTEALFLLNRGELPSNEQSRLLNLLMVFLANPGPRDAPVMAAF